MAIGPVVVLPPSLSVLCLSPSELNWHALKCKKIRELNIRTEKITGSD